MARQPRQKLSGACACYHVVMRANGREFKLDEGDMKDVFLLYLNKLTKKLFYARVVSFCCLSNHFHLVVNMLDPEDVNEKEAMKRWNDYHDKIYKRNVMFKTDRDYVVGQLTDVSSFMKRLNMHMTIRYNKATGNSGTMWEKTFFSNILQRGFATTVCSAYVELNSFRAGIVEKPEEYRYSSLYELRLENKDNLVKFELLAEGLDLDDFARHLADEKTFFRKVYGTYLSCVYKAGMQPHKSQGDDEEEEREQQKGLVITHEMWREIEKQNFHFDEGLFAERKAEFTEGKSFGTPEFTEQFYDRHIAKGKTGEEREEHMAKWVHDFSTGGILTVHFKGKKLLSGRSTSYDAVQEHGGP